MGKVVVIVCNSEDHAEQFENEIAAVVGNGYVEPAVSVEQDWHTPHELYEHRYTLFRALVFSHPFRYMSWKSKQHHDGTMFDDSFIVGVNLPDGPMTYHLPLAWWGKFEGLTEIEKAPVWDGCGPEEGLERLNKFVDALQDGRPPLV